MNTKNNPNILVVRLSSLGDIVLSSPVYKNIKQAWPNARITLLVKPAFSQALAGHPDIDEILVAKKEYLGHRAPSMRRTLYPLFGLTRYIQKHLNRVAFQHPQPGPLR